MKLGILDALRRTQQTGEPPVPEPTPAREQPMQGIHEQLLASLQEREAASPVLVPTITPGPASAASLRTPTGPAPQAGQGPGAVLVPIPRFAPYEDRDLSLGARAARGRDVRREKKGTIEEALGEPLTADPRAEETDDRPQDPPAAAGPAPGVGSPHPLVDGPQQPRAVAALGRACPVCEGRGTLALGTRMVPCGRCGGEGYVPDPHEMRVLSETAGPELVESFLPESPVEAALAREAAGVQALPLVDLQEMLGAMDVDTTRAVAETSASLVVGEADPGPLLRTHDTSISLTYDLPVDLQALPPFCHVCGPAGTGKSFQAKAWAAHDPEGVVLAATTGIAAVNLGEGTTINAFLRYYDTASLTEAFTGGWLESQLKKQRAAGLRRLVLDECSMLDGDQLTILTRAIDNVNADRREDDAELGLLLVGDFAQLPPVKAPFAFESAEWGRYAQATYGLTTIRRQADAPFIEALQAVRRGDHARALDFFAPRLEPMTHATFDGSTIFAKNDAVDRYNQLRLDKVHCAPLTFASQRWGKLRNEWGGPPQPPPKWGVPETLPLKIGALVMILANRNIADPGTPPEYLYVNGDLGTLVDSQHGTATVLLQRTGEPVAVVPITRENVIPLEPGRRKALKEEGHPERVSANGKHEVVGAVSYLPLRLAWGTTVHKSQGLSLDRVQVNIRDHFFCTPSMLYVALSRARTAEGLRLVGTPEGFRARCTVHPKVQAWL